MKTLEEHNKEADLAWSNAQVDQNLTGVSCECGEELRYCNPGKVNTSLPPTHWVFCPKCKDRLLMR